MAGTNENEVIMETSVYGAKRGLAQQLKCRINGEEHAVTVQTDESRIRQGHKSDFVPKKVGTMLQLAGYDAFINEGGAE